MNYSAILKKRIPPDIFTDSMQLILNKGKATVSQSNQSSEYQKKQEVKKSIANIVVILKTINIELQQEQDQEISLILSQQKEIFNKILSQKQTEQKNSFKTVENEIISQFQNQIKNLKKTVENKFNLILKSIETQSQKQSQNQFSSQLSSQLSNQLSNQSSSQASNQVKTYAQAAANNLQAEENSSQTIKQKKQQDKELQKEKYREKRLVIQVEKETAKNFNSYTLRNLINNSFFTKENIN